MDKYYLCSFDPPPTLPPVLIKVSDGEYSRWVGTGWIVSKAAREYLMGDYQIKELSEKQAEEVMQGKAIT